MALGDELRSYSPVELRLIRDRRECASRLCEIGDFDPIDAWRRKWAQERDEILALQKQAGKAGDREAARLLKEAAAEAMKMYRGACLVLPWLMSEPPGDCRMVVTREWPEELLPYARMAVRVGYFSAEKVAYD